VIDTRDMALVIESVETFLRSALSRHKTPGEMAQLWDVVATLRAGNDDTATLPALEALEPRHVAK
jgi:hypothetical protein